jgi:hypothetical protein
MAHALPMASREIGDNEDFARVSPAYARISPAFCPPFFDKPGDVARTACPKSQARPSAASIAGRALTSRT